MLLTISFADGTVLSLRTDDTSQARPAVSWPNGIPDSEKDERAFNPRCVHGVLFSDQCETCAAVDTSDTRVPAGVDQTPVIPQIADANTEADDSITLLP